MRSPKSVESKHTMTHMFDKIIKSAGDAVGSDSPRKARNVAGVASIGIGGCIVLKGTSTIQQVAGCCFGLGGGYLLCTSPPREEDSSVQPSTEVQSDLQRGDTLPKKVDFRG